MKHQWVRHKFLQNGKWKGERTCIQVWRCRECGFERERPDDDSIPSLEGCKPSTRPVKGKSRFNLGFK